MTGSAERAREAGLGEQIDLIRVALSWIEPPFITAETTADELRSRISFCLADAERALAAIEEALSTPQPMGEETLLLRELTSLAEAIHRRRYSHVTQWRPLDTPRGVLSQIDNMVAGLLDPLPQEGDAEITEGMLVRSERGYMLAPCHCGGRAEVHSYGGFNVVCLGTNPDSERGCEREGPEGATPEAAVAAWNAAMHAARLEGK